MKQLNWDFIKGRLAYEREKKKMESLGYRKHETDWEIHRGSQCGKVIVDVKISHCRKYVWTKIGSPIE